MTDSGLRRLALGTLLAAFPGPTAPDWAVRLLADGLAGHALFGHNITGPAQLSRLTGQLRDGRPDVLIAVDEEGGDVTRLGRLTGSPYPGNAALGAVDDPALTRAGYAAIGADLVAAGINLDLAPVVDVNTADDNPVIGTRSFGAEPQLVARHAAAAVVGLQSQGVAGCAKHFPGHGATSTDSHLTLPVVDEPLAVLRRRELPPFAAAIEAGARAVMTAHLRVPELTGDEPATFSRAALTDLLRGEYGFRGAVVTDALEMVGAAGPAGGVGPAAVRALIAGADLLCLGADVDAGLVDRVVAAVVSAVEDGRLSRRRLEQAAGRCAELASWARHPAAGAAADLGHAGAAPGQPSAAAGLAGARRAVRVEGVLPQLRGSLVVQLPGARSIPAERVPWGLAAHLPGDVEHIELVADEAPVEAIRAGGRPIVVVGRRLHRTPGTRALVERLAREHPVVAVEMGWPSSWRPAGVRAFVRTYGASYANGRAAAEALGLATAPDRAVPPPTS